MTSSIDISRVSPGAPNHDFEACAHIHKEAVSEGFLATLNPGVLERIYRTAADSPNAFLFAAKNNNDEIVGFICGSMHTGKFFRDCLSRYFLVFGWYMLPRLLSWRTIRRVFETLVYPVRKKNNADLPESEILNFCVTAAARGQGVGSRLFAALEQEFRQRDISAIRIVTGASQKEAIAFYESRNARFLAEIELHKGITSRVYSFDIT